MDMYNTTLDRVECILARATGTLCLGWKGEYVQEYGEGDYIVRLGLRLRFTTTTITGCPMLGFVVSTSSAIIHPFMPYRHV